MIFEISRDDSNKLKGQFFGGLKGNEPLNIDQINEQINKARELMNKNSFTPEVAKGNGISDEMYAYINATDKAALSAKDFYEVQLKNAQGFVNISRVLSSYNQIAEDDTETQEAFVEALSKSNEALAEYIKDTQGEGSAIGFTLKGMFQNIGLSLMDAGLSLLTTFIVQGISKLIHASEERLQSLKEDLNEASDTADAFREESAIIDDLQSRYTKIITSTQDLVTAKEELKSIQDELNEAYGEEVKNLDLVNKSYGENIQLLIDKNRERAKEYVGDEDEPNINRNNYNNTKKQLEGGKVKITEDEYGENVSYRKYGNYTHIHSSGWGNFVTSIGDSSVADILKEYDREKVLSGANGNDETGVTIDGNDIYFFGTLEEQLENLESIYAKFSLRWAEKEPDSNERQWLSDIKKEIDRLKEEIETYQNIIDVFEANERLANSVGNISSDIDTVTSAAQTYVNSDSTTQEKIDAIEQIKRLKESIYNANKDEDGKIIDQDVQDKLDEYFDGIDTVIDGRVNGIYDSFQVYKETLTKFTNETYEIVSSGLNKFDTAIASLRNGSSLDSNTVLELISLDPTLADSFAKIADGYIISLDRIQTARSDFYYNSTKDIKKEIDGINQEREKFEQEREVYISQFGSINSAGDLERFNSGLKDIDDKIKNAETSAAQWRFYLNSIGAQLTPVEQSLSKISEIQELISAQESLSKGLDIDDSLFSKYPELLSYNKSARDLYIQIGKIIDRIRNNTFEDLDNSSYMRAQIKGIKKLFAKSDFNQLVQQAEGVTSSLDTLRSAYDSVANGEPLDVAWFEDFPDLAKFAGDTEALLKALDSKSSSLPDDMIKAIEEYEKSNILSDMEEERLMAIKILLIQTKITNKKKLQESLTNANIIKEEERLDLLNKQKEDIENTISDYETAANTVINAIDDEIESLEEAKAAIEEKYNAEIEALQQENEERERSNALREKELALEKAKNNKVRVYSASRGWTIQTNTEEVRKAQSEYDSQLNENKIADLEKQRDSETAVYDERIKEYEDYKKLWQDTIDAYQNMQDEMTTAAVLGNNWRKIVYDKDIGALSSFTTNYGSYKNQLHGYLEPEITDIQTRIDKYQEEIDKLNDLEIKQDEYVTHFQEFLQNLRDTQDGDLASDIPGAVAAAMSGGGFKFLQGVVSEEEAAAKFNSFMSSGNPVSMLAGGIPLNNPVTGFNGVSKTIIEKQTQGIAGKQQANVNNNQTYSWTITGNEINADKYESFKGYMDRYVKEQVMKKQTGMR